MSATTLQRLFGTILQDRRVDWREAESLIADAQADGSLSGAEREVLAKMIALQRDGFDPSAVERLSTAFGAELFSPADPELPRTDRANTVYEIREGSLFENGVKPTDVVQGYLGDCFLMAAFSSVAAANPEAIQRAVQKNDDGTYTVRFHDDEAPGGVALVTVDGDFPTQGGAIAYGASVNKRELWVSVLEKAYASWQGGYDAIGGGGLSGDAMRALLGRDYDYAEVRSSEKPEELHARLVAGLEDGRAIVAGTYGSDARYTNSGVYANHCYTVLGAGEENGVKYVELRNPWGSAEPSGNGADDGVFRLPVEKFQDLFAEVYSG